MNSVKYHCVDEIPVQPWRLQGTVYISEMQAKFAAAKLWASCSNVGVAVKKITAGWTVVFWRRGVIKNEG